MTLEPRSTGAARTTATAARRCPTFRRWTWNDTATDGSLAASGGGVSTLFSKPSWQTGTGVPADGQRDVPDLALNSSADHDGYLICSRSSCVNGFRRSDQTLNVIGGTSAASPTFAGMVALLVQQTNQPQGNVNPILYGLAASSPNVFHDITTGNNMVPCTQGSKDCPSGGMIGFSAGPGYDLTTGLGSVDVGALAAAWNGPTNPDFLVSAQNGSLTLTRGTPATDLLTVNRSCRLFREREPDVQRASTLTNTTCSVNSSQHQPRRNRHADGDREFTKRESASESGAAPWLAVSERPGLRGWVVVREERAENHGVASRVVTPACSAF